MYILQGVSHKRYLRIPWKGDGAVLLISRSVSLGIATNAEASRLELARPLATVAESFVAHCGRGSMRLPTKPCCELKDVDLDWIRP